MPKEQLGEGRNGAIEEAVRPWGEKLKPPKMVCLSSINFLNDWYPVDMQTVRLYMEQYRKEEEGVPMGIFTPITLAEIDGLLFVGDGYCRLATKICIEAQKLKLISDPLPEKINFEREMPRLVKELERQKPDLSIMVRKHSPSTYQCLWDMRTSALMTGPHERVLIVRILEMANRTWPRSEWGKLGISFIEALRMAASTQQISKLSKEENKELKDDMVELARFWKRDLSTIIGYFNTYEKLHPYLTGLVRINAGEGELTYSHAQTIGRHLGREDALWTQPSVFELLQTGKLPVAQLDNFCLQLKNCLAVMPEEYLKSKFEQFADEKAVEKFTDDCKSVFLPFNPLLQDRSLRGFKSEIQSLIRDIFYKIDSQNLKTIYIEELVRRVAGKFRQDDAIISDEKEIKATIAEASEFIEEFDIASLNEETQVIYRYPSPPKSAPHKQSPASEATQKELTLALISEERRKASVEIPRYVLAALFSLIENLLITTNSEYRKLIKDVERLKDELYTPSSEEHLHRVLASLLQPVWGNASQVKEEEKKPNSSKT